MKKKAKDFLADIGETIMVLEALRMEGRKVKNAKEIKDSMKLIFCTECKDIVRLFSTPRKCVCGRSSGSYVRNSDKDAEISGPCIPIGFSNGDFHQALQARPQGGWGVRFDAFVIPERTASIKVIGKKK